MQCPTCLADADMLVNRRCVHCGDAEIVAMIEELRPE